MFNDSHQIQRAIIFPSTGMMEAMLVLEADLVALPNFTSGTTTGTQEQFQDSSRHRVRFVSQEDTSRSSTRSHCLDWLYG